MSSLPPSSCEPAAYVAIEPSWFMRALVRTREAIKQNLLPGLILQVFVMLVVGSYYLYEPATEVFAMIAKARQSGGYLFAGASTATFAGLIPFLIQKSRPKYRDRIPVRHVWYLLAFWFFMGMNFDLMMRCQAMLFGTGSDFVTLLCKTSADMLIYTPFCGLPMVSIGMLFRQNHFDARRTFAMVSNSWWWSNQYLPMLVANWIVWTVAIAAVYSLPLALQIPVQNLVMCFWCVLLIFLVDDKAG